MLLNKSLISKINHFLSKWQKNIITKINNFRNPHSQINISLIIISRPCKIINLKIIKVSHLIQLPEHHSNFIKKVKKVFKKEKNYKNKMLNKNLKSKFLIVLSIRIFLNLKRKLSPKKTQMFLVVFTQMQTNSK